MCDVVYVLLIDQLERWAMSERQNAMVMRAAGAEVDLPHPIELRRDFDAELISPFQVGHVDPERARLRRAVGLSA